MLFKLESIYLPEKGNGKMELLVASGAETASSRKQRSTITTVTVFIVFFIIAGVIGAVYYHKKRRYGYCYLIYKIICTQ